MPCGGIRPVTDGASYVCFYCNEKGCDHFVEEWDAFLHGRCVLPFLKTEEGECVIAHKHHIQVGMGVLQEEGGEFMDPNVVLQNIRDLIQKLAPIRDLEAHADGDNEDIAALVDAVENLDGWLSHGGFLPADWNKHRA